MNTRFTKNFFVCAFSTAMLGIAPASAAETIYQCGRTFQNRPCENGPGKVVGDLPQVARYKAQELGDDARARYSWSSNERPEHKALPPVMPQEILTPRVEALRSKLKEFADNIPQLIEVEGEQTTRGRLTRLRGELSSLCTAPTAYENLRKSENCEAAGEELMRAERVIRGE